MLHKMTAKAAFTNPRIATSPRGGGSILAGDTFETDYLHAKELVANKLAVPVDPDALDREPTDPVEPHHSLSVADHARINKRRAAAAGAGGDGGDGGDRTKAAERALERLSTARVALQEAEQAARDKPSWSAKAKLNDAQQEYDKAEAAAKEFTGT